MTVPAHQLAVAADNIAVLRNLDGPHEPHRLTRLAEALGRDKSNVSKTLQSLTAAGVTAKNGPGVWTLTSAGREAMAAVDAAEAGAAPAADASAPHAAFVPNPLQPRKLKPAHVDRAAEIVATASGENIADHLSGEPKPVQELVQLALSIRSQGVLQPLLAAPPDARGARMLVAGERRWRAAGMLLAAGIDFPGAPDLPFVEREADEAAAQALALVENNRRADLTPLERARAYTELCRLTGWSARRAAMETGETVRVVQEALQVLREAHPTLVAAHESGQPFGGVIVTWERLRESIRDARPVLPDTPQAAPGSPPVHGGSPRAESAGEGGAEPPDADDPFLPLEDEDEAEPPVSPDVDLATIDPCRPPVIKQEVFQHGRRGHDTKVVIQVQALASGRFHARLDYIFGNPMNGDPGGLTEASAYWPDSIPEGLATVDEALEDGRSRIRAHIERRPSIIAFAAAVPGLPEFLGWTPPEQGGAAPYLTPRQALAMVELAHKVTHDPAPDQPGRALIGAFWSDPDFIALARGAETPLIEKDARPGERWTAAFTDAGLTWLGVHGYRVKGEIYAEAHDVLAARAACGYAYEALPPYAVGWLNDLASPSLIPKAEGGASDQREAEAEDAARLPPPPPDLSNPDTAEAEAAEAVLAAVQAFTDSAEVATAFARDDRTPGRHALIALAAKADLAGPFRAQPASWSVELVDAQGRNFAQVGDGDDAVFDLARAELIAFALNAAFAPPHAPADAEEPA